MKLKLMAVAVGLALGSFMTRRGLAVGAITPVLEKDAWAKLPKDVQALYVEKDGKYSFEFPEGFEEVGSLKSALEKERDKAKTAAQAAKDLAKKFEGIDPDEVRKILDKMGSDEERQLMKDGKLDEVVTRRMTKAAAAHVKELEAERKKTELALAKAAKFEQRVVDNHIRAAAIKAGVHQGAVEDALMRGRAIFKADDEGNAVQLDGDGKVVVGKDTKTPFSPDEWLSGMKEAVPHWFPAPNAGGGGTGNKGGTKGRTINRAAFSALNPTEQALAAKEAREGKVTIVD
jgi:hypothetical protein